MQRENEVQHVFLVGAKSLGAYGGSIKYGYEIAPECVIGPGLRLIHRGGVCINPAAVLGENVTIFHGVTIGSTRRGKLKGSPTIGNKVWIGSNASIVGKIAIGDDVYIA